MHITLLIDMWWPWPNNPVTQFHKRGWGVELKHPTRHELNRWLHIHTYTKELNRWVDLLWVTMKYFNMHMYSRTLTPDTSVLCMVTVMRSNVTSRTVIQHGLIAITLHVCQVDVSLSLSKVCPAHCLQLCSEVNPRLYIEKSRTTTP